MNEEPAFLRYMAAKLDEARLPYMLTGSMAMMFYAVPRSTGSLSSRADAQWLWASCRLPWSRLRT